MTKNEYDVNIERGFVQRVHEPLVPVAAAAVNAS